MSRYPKLIFLRDYNHVWPSRAATLFPKGWEGRVKQEVADAALGKHAATLAPIRGKAASDEEKAVRPTGGMVRGGAGSPPARRARRVRGSDSVDVSVHDRPSVRDRLESDAQ